MSRNTWKKKSSFTNSSVRFLNPQHELAFSNLFLAYFSNLFLTCFYNLFPSFIIASMEYSMQVGEVPKLKPQRINNLSENDVDHSGTNVLRRHRIDILIGWFFFLGSTTEMEGSDEKIAFWKLGEQFGDYLCMDRLNELDRKRINEVASNKEVLEQDELQENEFIKSVLS